MRTAIGLILTVVGAGVIVWGLWMGLQELRGLYEGATNDALGMGATAEQDASKRMIRWAIVGACGVPLFVVGSVMLKITFVQRLMRGRGGAGRSRR